MRLLNQFIKKEDITKSADRQVVHIIVSVEDSRFVVTGWSKVIRKAFDAMTPDMNKRLILDVVFDADNLAVFMSTIINGTGYSYLTETAIYRDLERYQRSHYIGAYAGKTIIEECNEDPEYKQILLNYIHDCILNESKYLY